MLLSHGEYAHDALDCLRGVNGVQCGENKMARFGGFERDLNGFFISHLAHQDHLWRLAQRRPQREREAGRVTVQFPLMNDRSLVPMHEFLRIFDGDDVIRVVFIDSVENRGHGGGLSRAGRPGNQHNTVFQIGDIGQLLGQPQFGESGNVFGNDPHYDGVASPLHEYIDPKPAFTGQTVGNVARSLLSERRQRLLVAANKFLSNAAGVLGGQRR